MKHYSMVNTDKGKKLGLISKNKNGFPMPIARKLVVRLNARRPLIQDALLSGDSTIINNDLINVKESESLDFLTLTDGFGNVVMRTNYPYNIGNNLAQDEVINSVMNTKETVTTTTIL